MPRIRYTPNEKENALRLCEEIGVLKASEQTGISTHSLYKWRSGGEDETVPLNASEAPVEETKVEENDASTSEGGLALRKRYTAKEKENAVRLCERIGITKASKETGITVTSLRKWRAEIPETPASAADEPPVQESATQNVSQTDHGESTDIIARLSKIPTERTTSNEKASHSSDTDSNVNDKASEELIRLRIENSTLKAQIVSLKSALRVFTE